MRYSSHHKHKDKLDPENDDPFNSDKTLEKRYMYYTYNSPHMNWIVLRTESVFKRDGGLRKTEFEHLVDHTIRLKDTKTLYGCRHN